MNKSPCVEKDTVTCGDPPAWGFLRIRSGCPARGEDRALEYKMFRRKRSFHRNTSPSVRVGVVPSTNRLGHRTFNAAMLGKVNCRSRQERAAWAVQIRQGSAPRQKKPAPFRFRGLRMSRENSISAAFFFLSKPDPLRWAPVWGGPSRIGVTAARLTLTQEDVVSHRDYLRVANP